MGEELSRYYAARHNMKVISLRPGSWTGNPEPCIDSLRNRLCREDVAQAALKAIEYEPAENFEAFNVLADNPFGVEDVDDLRERPWVALERHYQGAEKLLKRHGVEWDGLTRILSCARAREKLGYAPVYTFERYLEQLRSLG